MSKCQGLGSLGNITALTLGLLFCINTPVNAGGFALNDQSVTFLGTAYTGTSSDIQDASTGYYNPAGLSELRYSQVLASGTYIHNNIRLNDGTATDSHGDVITGNNPTQPSSNLVVPAGHIAWRVSKRFSLGLSVIEPFGLNINYSSSAIARLMATKDKITTVDISPTFGLELNHYLSVGAGLDFLKTNTTFSSDVSWGGHGLEAGGFINNSANAWSFGYHVGILVKPWYNNRMGLVYFSRFTPKFTGALQYGGGLLDFGTPDTVTYSLSLPDRINYSVTQHFSRKFTTVAEVEWTHWSRLKQITMNYNSTGLPGILTFNFRNTWRAGVGADIKLMPRLILKLGGGYDQSPATNTTRSAMIPDADRYLAAIGAKFAFNQRLILSIGYAHAFYLNTSINESGANNSLNQVPVTDTPNLSTLNANVKNSADIVGAQISFNLYKSPEQNKYSKRKGK